MIISCKENVKLEEILVNEEIIGDDYSNINLKNE
jgi:hypothetical protein